MPDSIAPPNSRPSRPLGTGSWTIAVVALLPVVACFLGGSTQKWAEGIVWIILGLCLLAQPPRLSLGWLANCAFAGLILLALVAYLPADWFFMPAWRRAIVEDFAIPLAATVSPQPWITASALISLLGGLSWLYLVSTQDSELRAVRFQLRLFVAGVVVLAALSIALYFSHGSLPFWINNRNFGPFPNRNQTGDLLGISVILLLACGQDDLRRGRKRWIAWLIALSILVTAVFHNLSRAGMAILVGGSALWIFVVAVRKRSHARTALSFSFVLLLLSTVLILGGETLERFHLHGLAGTTGMSTDFRWKIFRDAFDLIRASPWCGVGLGNFEPVFATFRTESFGDTRALHPESDWLWLWSELGWPAIVLVLAGATALIRRVLPLQDGTNQRFRLAALVGALLFGVHGLVDVSAHRIGSSLAGLLLLGLSLHRPLELKRSRLAPIVFRLVGLILLVSGASWTFATRSKSLLPGSLGVSVVKELAPSANRARNFNESIALTTRALAWAPLDWQLYFTRALARIGAKQHAGALDDFRRARFLEPNAFEVPFAEGDVWLPLRPVLAATAWREALRRAGPQRAEVYSKMLTSASLSSPEILRIVEEVAFKEPDLAIAYLSHVSGGMFDRGVTELFKHQPNLEQLDETKKLALFALWSERGDLEKLARTVQSHQEWMPFAWFGLAKYNAGKNDFRAAYEMTQRFGDAVALPRQSPGASLEDLQQRYVSNPENYAIGYALFREQMQRGRIDDALVIARHFSERTAAPAYFRFLEAQGWAAKENWERAWTAWLSYRDAANRK